MYISYKKLVRFLNNNLVTVTNGHKG